jgi:hypothetical protein
VPPAVALINYMRSGILGGFFVKLGHFAGFSLRIHISFITLEGSAQEKKAVLHFRGFFYKTGIFFSPKGTAKLRWAVWGAEDIIFFRVPRSTQ